MWAAGMLALTIVVAGCDTHRQSTGVDLRGEIENFTATRVFICQVINQAYDYMVPIDTVEVQDGRFAWRCDTLTKDIYALAFETDAKLMNGSVYALLGEGEVRMKIHSTSYGILKSQSEGSALQERYERFTAGLRDAGHRDELDSIEYAFYAARDRGDTATMAALNEDNAPLYDQADEQLAYYIDEQLADSQRDFFTFYLYYTYDMSRTLLMRKGQLDTIEQRLSEWTDEDVLSSRLMRSARSRCELASRSVEGAMAEEIEGLDLSGNPLRLTSLRGQYVLIDFWASYCSWCRLETPILKEAYEKYGKAKGVEFLSISLDKSHDAWQRAVEEDGIPWRNVILDEAQAASVREGYNIEGIPLILLVDDEGRIVRRGLRGEEILQALAAL